MPQISLSHCLGFIADKRMSMDIYADSLAKSVGDDFLLQSIRPASRLERFSDSRLLMRYLRYWRYPQQVKTHVADLHHVLDHGYAHLHPYLKHGNLNTKTCITVHDLIPMLTWKGHLRAANGEALNTRKPWLNLKSLSYLAHYDRILSVSQSTKADLIRYLGVSAEKIDVIPPIISDIFKPSSPFKINELINKYEFERGCKWIMISGGEFYKNHRTCLEVLVELNQQSHVDFRLVKTGLPSPEFDQMVDELGLRSKVRSVYLEDALELVTLYSFIDCLLFPSLYEGFGMPVAEALACGTPVVTSDRGSLPEVGGELASICDAGDVEALSQAIISVVFDKSRKDAVQEQGPIWGRQFRSENIQPQLDQFYHSCLLPENQC